MPPLHKYRGLAVIIVNEFKATKYREMCKLFENLEDFQVKGWRHLKFDDLQKKLEDICAISERKGAAIDYTEMCKLFENLDFQVKGWRDLEFDDLQKKLHDIIMAEREGAATDYTEMCKLFENLDFQVEGCRDLCFDCLKWKLDDIKETSDLTDPECFVCVVSSHGKEKHDRKSGTWSPEFATAERHLSCPINLLVQHFSDWEAYAGKPKLFFIQACRTKDTPDGYGQMFDPGKSVPMIQELNADTGSELNKGGAKRDGKDYADAKRGPGAHAPQQESEVPNETGNRAAGSTEQLNSKGNESSAVGGVPGGCVPSKTKAAAEDMLQPPRDTSLIECPKDCLIMFPVVFGRAALRSSTKGSWMLRYLYEREEHKLVDQLMKDGQLLPYLTTVTGAIARHEFHPYDDYENTTKCAAVITHRLTEDVCFKPMSTTSPMAVAQINLMKF